MDWFLLLAFFLRLEDFLEMNIYQMCSTGWLVPGICRIITPVNGNDM